MDSIEILADYGDLCGESPEWDDRSQSLYWTDINGKRFYRYSWRDRRSEILSDGFEVAGAALREGSGFVVVNSSGVWRWEERAEPVLLADEVDGHKCQINDCVAGPGGRLFAGSCFFDPGREDYPRGYLFRFDPDGSRHIVDEGILLSNGLGFSPDESRLYYADSAARTIYVFDHRASDGSIRNRRALVQAPVENGIPDGLTVDADGFIWCAHWFGGGVFRYDPDGVLERKIEIPAAQTSSVAFGGPDLTDLFVTSAGLPDGLPLAPPGYDPAAIYSGGRLFHVNLGIAGKPEYRVAF